jgi:hypothetical protein
MTTACNLRAIGEHLDPFVSALGNTRGSKLPYTPEQVDMLRLLRDKSGVMMTRNTHHPVLQELQAIGLVSQRDGWGGQYHNLTLAGYEVTGSRVQHENDSQIWQVQGIRLDDDGVHREEDGWRLVDGRRRWRTNA